MLPYCHPLDDASRTAERRMIMELELVYNEETQEWEQKPEPFITIECETEEDFEFIGTAVAFYKKHLEEQEKPQTNADRIRAMSIDELANLLLEADQGNFTVDVCDEKYCDPGHCKQDCTDAVKRWLESTAEG